MKKFFSASTLLALFLGCAEAPAPTQTERPVPIAQPTNEETTNKEDPAKQAPGTETPLRYVMTSGNAYIRTERSSKSSLLGQTLPKARLPVFEEAIAPSSGCKSEKWLRVQYNGWICADQVKEADAAVETEDHIENKTPNQKAQLTKESDFFATPGGRVISKLDKNSIFGIIRVVTVDGKAYAQTEATDGSPSGFLLADDLKFLGKGSYKTSLKGEVFPPGATFPYVFFVDDTPLAETPGGPVAKQDKDKKYTGPHKKRFERFPVLEQQEKDGKKYLLVEGGWVLQSKSTALIKPEAPPEGLPREGRWLMVDLSDQTLIAYEGDRPTFATLVSSGKTSHKGAFWTVTGSFRLQRKYRYKDMEGEPFGEHYLVQDVPWPQYFFEGYALHGAFWHNKFGRVASHGCVNLAPVDAKWLSDFLHPAIPPGWYMILPTLEMETSTIVVRL